MDVHVVLVLVAHHKPFLANIAVERLQLFLGVAFQMPRHPIHGRHVAAHIADPSLVDLHVNLDHVRVPDDHFAAGVGAGYGVSAVLQFHVILEANGTDLFATMVADFEIRLTFFVFPSLPGAAVVSVVPQLSVGRKPSPLWAMPTLVLNVAVMPFLQVLFILGPSFGLEVWANTTLSVMIRASNSEMVTQLALCVALMAATKAPDGLRVLCLWFILCRIWAAF